MQWCKANEFLRQNIEKYKPKTILEIGSGANPTLESCQLSEYGIEYTTNDIDPIELEKANECYETLLCDFSASSLPNELHGKYDLIFSRMVNEHIKDGNAYYKNIHSALKPNGITIHCFSTLYATPFVVNRYTPDFFGDFLLKVFAPRNDPNHGKFKAYYSWSKGPTDKMYKNFSALGFSVEEYVGFYGHNYYKKRLPFLDALELAKSKFLKDHWNNPYLTSYAYVILKKQAQ